MSKNMNDDSLVSMNMNLTLLCTFVLALTQKEYESNICAKPML